ncbi:hypothetical protein PILCRDRAFT_561593 [Piloderma croceum F 1598]|uniref:Uncharacterized protein n=1 Tax=Piloderma croceum (strain F 1598) TaxID=765440 RepID=A0A0C3F3D1_PILCF|nr:hypothetical protein PILCRDRAFT_561593 [Piloderma croceum F 1598]
MKRRIPVWRRLRQTRRICYISRQLHAAPLRRAVGRLASDTLWLKGVIVILVFSALLRARDNEATTLRATVDCTSRREI